jgi:hypothetical protein
VIPKKDHSDIIQRLGSKKHIRYQFLGDDYKTKIWRDAKGDLMASDPDYPTGRRMIPGDLVPQEAFGVDPRTVRGIFVGALVNALGHEAVPSVEISFRFMPLIRRCEELMAKDGKGPHMDFLQAIIKAAHDLLEKEGHVGAAVTPSA